MKIQFVIITAILLFTLSCKKNTDASDQSSVDSVAQEEYIAEESGIKSDPELSIILLPFNYESDDSRTEEENEKEEIRERDKNAPLYNPNDSIAIGGTSDEGSFTGLFGRLALGKRWLCVEFPNEQQGRTLGIDIVKTDSYSIDWLEDSITVISNDKGKITDHYYDIAFRGDYSIHDFKMIEYSKVERNSDEAKNLVTQLRKALPNERMRKMFHMSSDTIILKDIRTLNLSDKKVFIMTFATPTFNDSDVDFSNEVIFVFENGKIRYVDSGFHCYANCFQLKNKEYLLITASSYAGYCNYLFDMKTNLEKSVFDIGKATD